MRRCAGLATALALVWALCGGATAFSSAMAGPGAPEPPVEAPATAAGGPPPAISELAVTLRSNITERLAGAGVSLWWVADGDVARSEAEQSVNGGSYTPIPHEWPAVGYVLRDRTMSVRARVLSSSGPASPWSVSQPFKVTAAAPVVLTGRWTAVTDPTAIDGSTRYTTMHGARASLRFYGSSVAWVSSTGSDRGRATVIVDDKRVKTVDLAGPTKIRRAVYSTSWPTSGWHRIEVLVAGTIGRPRVDVDAFLVLRALAPSAFYWTQTGLLRWGATYPITARLGDGSVLVAGAWAPQRFALRTNYARSGITWGGWWSTKGMIHPRATSAGVLLRDGRVLVPGGSCCGADGDSVKWAEVFVPVTDSWQAVADMNHARSDPGVVLLADGRVLVVGGLESGAASTATAEIFDPSSGRWTATGSMTVARSLPLAARLPDGRVLVAGGFSFEAGPLDSTEVWDPATGRWTLLPTRLSSPRAASSATMTALADGRVLVAGGFGNGNPCTATAEYFDGATMAWNLTGSMSVGRCFHAMTGLPDGSVLVVGGTSSPGGSALASAEVYRPGSGRWSRVADMAEAREGPAIAVLATGDVLVAGGLAQRVGVSRTGEILHVVTTRASSAGR